MGRHGILKYMTKLFQLKENHDFENSKSGLTPSESSTLRTVEPKTVQRGKIFVDEPTLWAIAKQIENEEKGSKSK